MKKYLIPLIIIILGLLASTTLLGVRNRSLKAEKKTLKAQVEQQAETIKQLAEMEAVALKIDFVINNKAVFGSIKNGDVQPYINACMTYSRAELLKDKTKLDSISQFMDKLNK
jgi:nitrate reductase cytochrome c-type subunit